MRVAFFSDAYRPRVSGLVSSLDEFSQGLRERGHEVLIVCPSYPPERMRGIVDPPHVLRVPSGTAIVSKEDRLAQPWKLKGAIKAIRAFDPEIVHVQTEFSIGSLGRLYCRNHGLPIVSTCHTHYESYMASYVPFLPGEIGRTAARVWLRSIYSRDDFVAVPSLKIADLLRSYGVDKDFAVLPTGVDERVFKPEPEAARALRAELARKHPRLASGPLAVYAGRVGHEKNIRILVDAMRIVSREIPEASLLVVGEGPARAELRNEAHRRGIGDKVFATGYVDRSILPAYYSMADIFVFPSVTETQGLVTIEAMLCGTPVVGVAEMGTGDIMEDDKGGLLASNDAASFADKMIRLLKDPELRARKSAEARLHAVHWSLGNSVSKLEALYERALASRRAR